MGTARPALTGLRLVDHANCALRQLGTEPSRAHSDSPSRDSEQNPGRFRASPDGLRALRPIASKRATPLRSQCAPEDAVGCGDRAQAGKVLVVHALGVAPRRPGRGASRMSDEVILTARQLGGRAVRLDVRVEKVPARRVCVGCGFTDLGCYELHTRARISPISICSKYFLESRRGSPASRIPHPASRGAVVSSWWGRMRIKASIFEAGSRLGRILRDSRSPRRGRWSLHRYCLGEGIEARGSLDERGRRGPDPQNQAVRRGCGRSHTN